MSHHHACCCTTGITYIEGFVCECDAFVAGIYLIPLSTLLEDYEGECGVYTVSPLGQCVRFCPDGPQVVTTIGSRIYETFATCEACCDVVYCPGTLCACDAPKTSGAPTPLVRREKIVTDIVALGGSTEGTVVYYINGDCWEFTSSVTQTTVGSGEMVVDPNEPYEECADCCPVDKPACCTSGGGNPCLNRADGQGAIDIEYAYSIPTTVRQCCPVGETGYNEILEESFTFTDSGTVSVAVGASEDCDDISVTTTPTAVHAFQPCASALPRELYAVAQIEFYKDSGTGEPRARMQVSLVSSGISVTFTEAHCFHVEGTAEDHESANCLTIGDVLTPYEPVSATITASATARGRQWCTQPDDESGGMMMAMAAPGTGALPGELPGAGGKVVAKVDVELPAGVAASVKRAIERAKGCKGCRGRRTRG